MEVPLFRHYTVFIFFQFESSLQASGWDFAAKTFINLLKGPKESSQTRPSLLGAVFFLFQSVCIRESYLYNLFVFLNPAISWRQCQKNL